MDIWFDKLQYIFQWTGFAATEEFKDIRPNYVASAIGASLDVDIDMPPPLINIRTIGKWTLGDPIFCKKKSCLTSIYLPRRSQALDQGPNGTVWLGNRQLG